MLVDSDALLLFMLVDSDALLLFMLVDSDALLLFMLVDSDALLFRVLLNTTIPRVYACVCAHVREGFFSFALVCKYLGRFGLEIRRRYYCTAYFPLKDFRF